MRGIFWRVVAIALAGVVGWMLWQQDEPEPEPVVFALEPPCSEVFHEREDGRFECWNNGQHVIIDRPTRPDP